MIRLQAGDREAFEAIVEIWQGVLLGFFFRNTRDRQLSEDLAQETLLRVYNHAWNYLPQGRFRGWMFRIARNLLIDTARRHSNDALVRAVRGRAEDDVDLAQQLTGTVIGPDQQAGGRELLELVDRLLGQIPEDQRIVFTLHHQAGLTLAEVAEVVEAPVSTCKSRLRLAREKLSSALRQYGVQVPGPPSVGDTMHETGSKKEQENPQER